MEEQVKEHKESSHGHGQWGVLTVGVREVGEMGQGEQWGERRDNHN